MNGPPKGGPLTVKQCKALQARVASLEAALTGLLGHHDALCVEHGLAPNCGATKAARAALAAAPKEEAP